MTTSNSLIRGGEILEMWARRWGGTGNWGRAGTAAQQAFTGEAGLQQMPSASFRVLLRVGRGAGTSGGKVALSACCGLCKNCYSWANSALQWVAVAFSPLRVIFSYQAPFRKRKKLTSNARSSIKPSRKKTPQFGENAHFSLYLWFSLAGFAQLISTVTFS